MDYSRNIQSFNINSFNSVAQPSIIDDRAQVLQWLSPLEPHKRQHHLGVTRLESVGGWIFRTRNFRRWNTGGDRSPHSVLLCHGDPGVGKTYLSSLVIDHFYGSGQNTTVAGLYCDYLDRREQTTSNMLGAMLKQLVGGGDIPGDIRRAFEGARGHFGGVGPRVPELLKMLKTEIGQRQRVVICIDGLDESLPTHRVGLLSSLQAIVRESPNVRLFLTGRPFIRSEVENYFPDVTTIRVSPTKDDTRAFLRMKLERDTEPDAMDERLRADIMEAIPEKISEIFLLVSLSIDGILGETTIHRREEKLKQILKGQAIGDLYTATLARIRAQEQGKSRLGMEAIMWIAHSERPLKPGELCQALGVEIGSRDLNSRNVPSIRTILNCGMGLVTVDSSSSTMRLVHFTLQEYILANPALFLSPHSLIAEVCLTYLNFACIRNLSQTLSSPPPTAPFLEYTSYYWGRHARREASESVISLAVELLDQFDKHISGKLLFLREREWWRPPGIKGKSIGFTGLHGGAIFGVAEIMAPLFETKRWDFNTTDPNGDTAMAWAARKGHGGVVNVLLERNEVNPDAAGKGSRTPLSLAAGNGYEGIVKILLERSDVNPDTPDKDGATPLSWAALAGHEGVVKMLLERKDVNPGTPDKRGQTPLLLASLHGNEGVAKILLERSEVDPDSADERGRTPLSRAAEAGSVGIVGMLLNRNNVNPNAVDESGRTPLSWAAESWRVEIVEMLLEQNDVNPDMADENGRTPFSWAAAGWATVLSIEDHGAEGNSDRGEYLWATENQRERTAEVLLGRNDASPDTADKCGRTPFSWAASHGHKELVEILLERNDVNPNKADEEGQTPLSWAVRYGHEEIVRMLLEQSKVNPDARDKSGRTPLSWAAENWCVGIVEMLLGRNDVNPDTPDGRCRTPFSLVASGPAEEWNDDDYETEGNCDRTRYTWFAYYECGRIAKMFLGQDGVDPDAADKRGRTPLSHAAQGGREGVVKMLLQRGDVAPDTPDENGRTPLSWAAERGKGGVVKMFLERGDVGPGVVDVDGETPLSYAHKYCDEEIVGMLLEYSNAGPVTVVADCRTQFLQGVENGHEGIVGRLLEQCEFNRNTEHEASGTTYSRAAAEGQEGIDEMVLGRSDFKPNTENETDRTPFLRDDENGRARAVPMLDQSEPSTTEPSSLPEPPLKRIRRF